MHKTKDFMNEYVVLVNHMNECDFYGCVPGCLRNTECTGKSPDPLYLRAGDPIHPVLLIKESGTETRGNMGFCALMY